MFTLSFHLSQMPPNEGYINAQPLEKVKLG